MIQDFQRHFTLNTCHRELNYRPFKCFIELYFSIVCRDLFRIALPVVVFSRP